MSIRARSGASRISYIGPVTDRHGTGQSLRRTSARASWADTISRFEEEARSLEQAILAFPGHRLNEQAPAAEPQTFYVLLHGAVQHNLYHAGQIALLKKM
jgi:hypothetical protein